jgi:hypothetical protein
MTPKEQSKDEMRTINPETEAVLAPGPIPLLQRYETIIGSKLRKLGEAEATVLAKTGGKWYWNWLPEQVAMFLSDWDNQVYMASPVLRDLALTQDPMGGGALFERFCRPEIIAAIKKIQVMYDKPLGKFRPVPKGTFSADLRACPPGLRPKVFSVNNWKFWGLVKDLPEDLATTLAYMHSRWMGAEMRRMDGMDHSVINVGDANRPGGGVV